MVFLPIVDPDIHLVSLIAFVDDNDDDDDDGLCCWLTAVDRLTTQTPPDYPVYPVYQTTSSLLSGLFNHLLLYSCPYSLRRRYQRYRRCCRRQRHHLPCEPRAVAYSLPLGNSYYLFSVYAPAVHIKQTVSYSTSFLVTYIFKPTCPASLNYLSSLVLAAYMHLSMPRTSSSSLYAHAIRCDNHT